VSARDVWEALEGWAVAEAIRSDAVLYPITETAHLVGVAIVLGAVATLDLRLLGLSRALPAGLLGRHTLALVWAGFAVAVVSGVLLFATRATALADNPALQVKAALLLLAGLNAACFHVGPGRSMLRRPQSWTPSGGARLIAAMSLTLWLAVAVGGQWIAYA
jgi:hypothetical protein